MKTLCGFVLVLAAVVGFVACAPVAGDGCNEAPECGSALTCVSCNANTDGGTDEDVYFGTCQKICETDTDCAGTTGRHGATTVCGQNTCGTRYCTIPFPE